jgi:hypothetical protein
MKARMSGSGLLAVVTSIAMVSALCAAAVAFAASASAGVGAQLYDLTCQGVVLGQPAGPAPTAVLIVSTSITPDPAFPNSSDVSVVGDMLVGVNGRVQADVLADIGAGTGSVSLAAGSTLGISATNSLTGPIDVDISGNSTTFTGRAIGTVTLTGSSLTSAVSTFTVADEGASVAINSTDIPGALTPTAQILTFVDEFSVVLSETALVDGTGGAALAQDDVILVPGANLGTFTSAGISGDVMDFIPVVTPATAINLDLGGSAASFNNTNDDGVNPVGCNYLAAGSTTLVGADYLPFGSAALSDSSPVINGGLDIAAAASATLPTTQILVDGVDDQGITSWGITPVSAVGAATLTNYGIGDSTIIEYSPPSTSFEGLEQFEISASDGTTTSTQQVFIDVVGGDTSGQGVGTTVGSATLDLTVCGSSGSGPATCSIDIPGVQLDGTTQTTAGSINQVTVVDARGLAVGWTLTALLDGPLTNENWTLSGVNAEIPASNMLLQNQSCTIVDGPGSTVVPGSAGTLDSPVTVCTSPVGSSGGTFTADADLDLTVPASVLAGNYSGTITFVIS